MSPGCQTAAYPLQCKVRPPSSGRRQGRRRVFPCPCLGDGWRCSGCSARVPAMTGFRRSCRSDRPARTGQTGPPYSRRRRRHAMFRPSPASDEDGWAAETGREGLHSALSLSRAADYMDAARVLWLLLGFRSLLMHTPETVLCLV